MPARAQQSAYNYRPKAASAYQTGRTVPTGRNVRPQNAYANGRTETRSAYRTEGNLAVQPQYRPRPAARPNPAPKPRVRYQEAERTATISITLPLTMILVAAVVAALVIGYNYLRLKSSLDVHMDSIKTLETTLDNLRTENDALERSIDTSIDLNYVYAVAVNELGMVRAGQGNIIPYDKTESEYVRQYEDIPAAN